MIEDVLAEHLLLGTLRAGHDDRRRQEPEAGLESSRRARTPVEAAVRAARG